MEKLTVFCLESCPYCQKAKRAPGELTAENAAYGSKDKQARGGTK